MSKRLHEQAFLKAAEDGELAKVKNYVESGMDIECKGSDGETALILASHAGNLEVAWYLLQNGADVDQQSDEGDTALIACVIAASADKDDRILASIRLLLEHGANVEMVERNDHSALDYARDNDLVTVVEMLEGNRYQKSFFESQKLSKAVGKEGLTDTECLEF